MSCHLQHSNSTRLCCASPACCRNVYEAIRRSELWTMRRNDCNGNLKTPHFHTLSHTFRDLERVFLSALSFLTAHRDCRKIRILLRLCPDLCLCRRPKRMTGFVFGFFFFCFFGSQRGADLEEVNLSCLDRLGLAIILYGGRQVLFHYTLAVGLLFSLDFTRVVMRECRVSE